MGEQGALDGEEAGGVSPVSVRRDLTSLCLEHSSLGTPICPLAQSQHLL